MWRYVVISLYTIIFKLLGIFVKYDLPRLKSIARINIHIFLKGPWSMYEKMYILLRFKFRFEYFYMVNQ